MKKLTSGIPPISTEKPPDDVCRLAVRACLSARKGKSVREISTKCDLGMNTTRRHLRNLIEMSYARKIGRGSGTKYLSSRPGRSARREIEVNLTTEQADKLSEGIREYLLDNCNRWRRSRGLPPR